MLPRLARLASATAAIATLGGAVGCISSASTLPGPTTTFRVAVEEGQLDLYRTCGEDRIHVWAARARDCVEWGYREDEVGVVQASMLTARWAEFADESREPDWPEQYAPELPANRRPETRHTTEVVDCRMPAVGVLLVSSGEEYVTDRNGHVGLPMSDKPVVVSIEGRSWVVDCGDPTP